MVLTRWTSALPALLLLGCGPDSPEGNQNNNHIGLLCGDGVVGGAEVCDDGNTVGGDGCSADCLSDESCGNGIVDTAAGEVCDDGNTEGGDGCSADCGSNEDCGNNQLDAGEACDDGNTVGGDGCSADCLSDESCGNGVVDTAAGEACDDENAVGGDGCSADCLSDETCGNGVVDTAAGEQCDDENSVDGDGCQADCQLPVCGDAIIDTDEDCDGSQLGTATCQTEGFFSGTLGCTSTCTFDTSCCTDCGNGTLDTGEACDGGAFGTATCQTEGFYDGTLGCTSACTFDTSGCTDCGNGTLDTGEDCDGGAFGTATCQTEGFYDGALGCTSTCTFDTSGCTDCGNGTLDAGEDCDGGAFGSATCQTEGFFDGALGCTSTCTFDTSGCTDCGDGNIDVGEDCDASDLGGQGCVDLGLGFTAGTLACGTGCAFDTSGCTSVPWPGAGDVIVTEIMQNPSVLADADGEWFELHNLTNGDLQLAHCRIEGSNDTGFTVDVDLTIPALGYLVFSVTSQVDQGFVPDFQWASADFGLNNSSDTVRLVCDGVTVDEVSYDDGATFPDPNGQSMSLDLGSYDAASNDLGANWCEGTASYNGDFGTPGAENPICTGPVTYSIDFCRLQFPLVIDEIQGTQMDVYGRVYIAGLTDLSGVNDPAPSVIGYVGYGPDGTDPAVDPGWVWVAGVPNAGYGPASPLYEAAIDEYRAVLTIPSPPGSYDFAFSFSGDGGATFVYCDGKPEGSSNGYWPADAGQMTSQAAPVPTIFFSEYAEGSSYNKAIEIYNAHGVDDADLTACQIKFYFNGSTSAGNIITLSGTLAAGDVFVVCDDGIIDPSFCDLLNSGAFFNGNDAVELVCSGVTLDVIGQIGYDPGTEWNVGGVGTADETLRRSCSVTTGDASGYDVFDPSLEWASFPQDTFSDFGQHVCP